MSNCDYCGEDVASEYAFNHVGVWYSGHKRCMGAPMIRKLAQESVAKTLPNIGLIGKLRAGKDEVARYLADKYGYTRFAFGDELKRYAHELFGETDGSKPRELYQWFGQTMRERDPEIWVRKCFDAITKNERLKDVFYSMPGNEWSRSPFRAVITDCRQENEFSTLQSAGYVLIRVIAQDGIRIQRAVESGDTFNLADLTHGTETALDGYTADYTVVNDGTLDELYAQIDAIVAELTLGREAA